MLPIVGVSLEEALLGFGGDDDAELHDKEVTLTTSDVTGSQTAIFEYDPEDEDPQGTPPGPWDGYSLFTIDLSGVKDDIEDLQQRISDAETCRQQVIAALQRYDPDYDPAEGECPSDKVGEVVDEVGELEDELEQCHDCKDATVAAMQAIDPDYVIPASGCIDDIPDKAYQKGRDDEAAENPPGYTFPPYDPDNPDPDRANKIFEITKGDPVKDETTGLALYIKIKNVAGRSAKAQICYKDAYGQEQVVYGVSYGSQYIQMVNAYFQITNSSTGSGEITYTFYNSNYQQYSTHTVTFNNKSEIVGYGDPAHNYSVTKSS